MERSAVSSTLLCSSLSNICAQHSFLDTGFCFPLWLSTFYGEHLDSTHQVLSTVLSTLHWDNGVTEGLSNLLQMTELVSRDWELQSRSCGFRICVPTLYYTASQVGSHKLLFFQWELSLILLLVFWLRYNSHTIKFTLSKCTVRWVLVYSQSCVTITAI